MFDTIRMLFESDGCDAYPEWLQRKINWLQDVLTDDLSLDEQDRLLLQLSELTDAVELFGFMRGYECGCRIMDDIAEGTNHK